MLKVGQANNKNSKYQLWRNDNHPIELYSNEVISQKVDYIHNNPLLEVISAEDCLCSSAKNYYSEEGLLEVHSF